LNSYKEYEKILSKANVESISLNNGNTITDGQLINANNTDIYSNDPEVDIMVSKGKQIINKLNGSIAILNKHIKNHQKKLQKLLMNN
jgi:paraquat-inducible protein B